MLIENFTETGTKIICIGLNYKSHAKEMGAPLPKNPIVFAKSTNSYAKEGTPLEIPPGCENYQQEVELGVIIGKTAKNTIKEFAMDYVAGYTVALDMTARDFQNEAAKSGTPWFLSKSFDTSCPVSGFIEKSKVDPFDCEIHCSINGIEKQRSRTSDLIFDVPSLIAYVSQYVTLYPGDVILTGTPAGVTPLKSGDKIEFGITDVTKATFFVK